MVRDGDEPLANNVAAHQFSRPVTAPTGFMLVRRRILITDPANSRCVTGGAIGSWLGAPKTARSQRCD